MIFIRDIFHPIASLSFPFYFLLNMKRMYILAKFWKQGIHFSCHQCGHCCTFPGGAIYATEDEFRAIADHLNISLDEFYLEYTESIGELISIKSHPEGPCYFYNNGCTIYSVRPTQCRTYPFWPEVINRERDWEKEGKTCQGIGQGRLWTKEEIRAELQKNIQHLKRSNS